MVSVKNSKISPWGSFLWRTVVDRGTTENNLNYYIGVILGYYDIEACLAVYFHCHSSHAAFPSASTSQLYTTAAPFKEAREGADVSK
jgi:hypothetical protein